MWLWPLKILVVVCLPFLWWCWLWVTENETADEGGLLYILSHFDDSIFCTSVLLAWHFVFLFRMIRRHGLEILQELGEEAVFPFSICFEDLSYGPVVGHCDFTSLALSVITLVFERLVDSYVKTFFPLWWSVVHTDGRILTVILLNCPCSGFTFRSEVDWTPYFGSGRARGCNFTWKKVNGRNPFWLKPSFPKVPVFGLVVTCLEGEGGCGLPVVAK